MYMCRCECTCAYCYYNKLIYLKLFKGTGNHVVWSMITILSNTGKATLSKRDSAV